MKQHSNHSNIIRVEVSTTRTTRKENISVIYNGPTGRRPDDRRRRWGWPATKSLRDPIGVAVKACVVAAIGAIHAASSLFDAFDLLAFLL